MLPFKVPAFNPVNECEEIFLFLLAGREKIKCLAHLLSSMCRFNPDRWVLVWCILSVAD